MMSSESMAPRNPKSAPDAPTDIDFSREIEDDKLPPMPERTYKIPTLTEKLRHHRINHRWVARMIRWSFAYICQYFLL